MIRRTGRFERADRILDSGEFRRIGRSGKRLASAQFVVLIASPEAPRETECRRLGVTVSRRVGNAVVRNRIKRGVREWFRRDRESLTDSIDLIVIARKPAASLSAEDVAKVLNEMLFAERSASS
jgi:ribonuclease P protein component